MFYSNLVYALITVGLLSKLLKKDINLFHVMIFVLPFHSWIYNVGLNLTIHQIVTLIMIITTILLSLKKKKYLYNFRNKYIVLFLLFAIIDTIIVSVFFIDEFLPRGGFFRSEGRFITQIVLLLIIFSIVPLAFNYIKRIQDVQKYLKTYLYSIILLVILGWIQYLIYNFAGFDIFPLNVNEFGAVRSGLFDFEGSRMFRMSSLGGEPKGFSMSLVMGFFIIHIFNRHSISFFENDTILKYLFLFTSFTTLSTSGIVLFFILLVVDLLYTAINSKKSIKLKSKDILYSSITIIIIGFLLFYYWDFASKIIEQRVFERNIASEDFDEPIKEFLSKSPEYLVLGSGIGNIHNLAYQYIPLQNLSYMEELTFVAKSGYLRTISELGLIGFSLFVYMFYSVYRKLGKVGKSVSLANRQIFKAMQLLLVIALMAYFARIYVYGELILFLAMANVLAYSKELFYKENYAELSCSKFERELKIEN